MRGRLFLSFRLSFREVERMAIFLQQVVNGLAQGGIYALIAIGWPDIDPEAPKRKSVSELLTYL